MIICAGEALIDMVPDKTAAGSECFRPIPGGAVFNTAIALGRLGEPVGFVSGLSTDMFGETLLEALHASRVSSEFCIRSQRPTTLAFVRLTGSQAEYSFFDENSAGRLVTEADLPSLPAEAEALHLGAISLIPEPCGSAYESLAKRNADKRVISLDPNIRPGFITDAAAHRARIERLIALADIVKVSDEDLAWIAPDLEESAIASWLQGKTKVVLLTRGKDGVEAFTKFGNLSVSAPAVKVADTIGAGDTFNAGLLAGIKRQGILTPDGVAQISEQQLRLAMALGVKVAAHTVARTGANPPWQEELG